MYVMILLVMLENWHFASNTQYGVVALQLMVNLFIFNYSSYNFQIWGETVLNTFIFWTTYYKTWFLWLLGNLIIMPLWDRKMNISWVILNVSGGCGW